MRRLATLGLILISAAFIVSAAPSFVITTTSLPPALFGQPYAPVTLDTTGDPGPIAWSFAVGAPAPSGFVVGPAPVITQGTFCYGFPAQSGPPLCTGTVQTFPGVYNFIIQATSLSTGQVATKQFTLAVVQQLQIITATLPDAAANQPYAVQIVTQGGTGQFAWTVPFGTLPAGMALDPANGTLAGNAPNVTATYNFTIQVQDQVTLQVASRPYILNVQGGIAITTTALPNAYVGQAYSFQMQSAGGQTLVWSIPLGWTLPPGFSISPSGLLTGFGVSTGIFQTRIQAMEQESQVVVTRDYTFNVTQGPLRIAESTIPAANQNVAYRATLTPSGGIPPYRWSFDIPSPQSLSISPTTGVITGTPPNSGTFALPVSLRDATQQVFSQSFAFSVLPAVSITTTLLGNGLPGVPYSDFVTANGGSLPYRWSVSTGTLPPGLSLNATSGQITGVPSASGAFPFTVQVLDSLASVATKNLTITIGAGQLLSITTASLPDGAVNQTYSQQLAATGGTQPLTWSLGSGSLPTGLILDAAGVISGTPTILGTFSFDVVVTDVNKAVARKSLTINIGNAGTPVTITSGNFAGVVLSAFSQTVTATGGTPPYTFTIPSGTLPSGLNLNAATGVISGTPGAGGTSTFTVTATDARGQFGSKTISISIILPPPPTTSITVGNTSQPAVSLTIGSAYPVDITGVLTLTFASAVGGTGEEARFAPNGTRSLNFTVPANTTQATFQTANAAIITGTVSGTITLTVSSLSASGQNITPSPAPTKTITVDAAVPAITSVTLQQVTGGVSVVVQGYSNTREVSSGSFTFTVSSSTPAALVQVTVPLTSAFTTWFNNSASNATGGQFRLTVPFSITGSATSVTKVSVTLTNSKGASAAATSP